MFGFVGIICTHTKPIEETRKIHQGLVSPFRNDGRTISKLLSTGGALVSVVEPDLPSHAPTTLHTFDDGIQLAFFGDIFNDLASGELQADYIHKLFVKDGPRGFASLNGSFFLCIHDGEKGETHLATDRFSSRPLFYYVGEDYLIFSPDQRSFVDSGCVPPKANLAAAAAMLACGHLHHDDAYIQDVKFLSGGSALRIQQGKTKLIKYWDYEINPQDDEGKKAYHSRLSDLLLKAVERRLRRESSPALLLSGGVDSRALLGACMELGVRVDLCSYSCRGQRGSDAHVQP